MVATDPLDSGTYTMPKITKKNSGSVMVTECKKKGKLIMENRKFTINGESNPKKCGVFDEFYESGASEYSGINVLEDGTLRIDFLARHLSRHEINNFHTEPLKVYGLHIGNDCYAILLRGMVNMDVIIDPSLYPDNRIEKVKEKNECICFLVDTASNVIMGIKFLRLNNMAISFVANNLKRMNDMGVNETYCAMAYINRIIPYTAKELVRCATYYGKSDGSVSTENLFDFGACWDA